MSDHVCGILLLLDFFLSFVKVLKAMLASSCHLLFMTSDGKLDMRTQRSERSHPTTRCHHLFVRLLSSPVRCGQHDSSTRLDSTRPRRSDLLPIKLMRILQPNKQRKAIAITKHDISKSTWPTSTPTRKSIHSGATPAHPWRLGVRSHRSPATIRPP